MVQNSEMDLNFQQTVSFTTRINKSPFWEGVIAGELHSLTVYNHTFLPAVFKSLEEDCKHLKSHVQLWDVACQRQVEITGQDSALLVQMMTPRPLDGLKIGRCMYVPAVDNKGRMINDPVLLKLAEDKFRFSIADSDLRLYALGLAAGKGLKVSISEPDVSPLAVQGPKSEKLMERVFGQGPKSLNFFDFDWFSFNNTKHIVARSGWSKQGGFEIYVQGSSNCMPMWKALINSGEDLNVRAGCPNYIERIEGGLLSFGGDITSENSPYEARLEAYFDADKANGCLGREALLRELDNGIKRQIRCVEIVGNPITVCDRIWSMSIDDQFSGTISAAIWSPDYEKNLAIAMVESDFWDENTKHDVMLSDGKRTAIVCSDFPNRQKNKGLK